MGFRHVRRIRHRGIQVKREEKENGEWVNKGTGCLVV
jgi:hypothetical protein